MELIRARYDAVNSHDWKTFEGFYADSIVWDDPGLSEPISGPRSVRKRLENLSEAFPDLQWKLERIFGDGDQVCAEFTFTGTHRGDFLAPDRERLPASNTSIRIKACGVYVVRNGKIVDSKLYFDFGGLKSQILRSGAQKAKA
ncbi:MAG TPA: ester cyclase [Pyrinomonadaceae bacterium]